MQLAVLFCLIACAFAAPFSWDTCGGSAATVSYIKLNPYPITLGKNLSIATGFALNIALTPQTLTSVALHLSTKTFGVWVEIPCVDGVGSCTLDDPCALLGQAAPQICPILQPAGIPCQCPLAKGTYQTPAAGLNFDLQNPGISWLTNGDFYVKATFLQGSTVQYCLEVYFSLESGQLVIA